MTQRTQKSIKRGIRLCIEISAQEKWMVARGKNLSGYIDHYGTADDPDRCGDGGAAIYAADKAELDKLRVEWKAVREEGQ